MVFYTAVGVLSDIDTKHVNVLGGQKVEGFSVERADTHVKQHKGFKRLNVITCLYGARHQAILVLVDSKAVLFSTLLSVPVTSVNN